MRIARLLQYLIIVLLIIGTFIFLLQGSPKNSTTSQENISPNNLSKSQVNDSKSFIEELRQREFQAGEIKIEETLSNNGVYTGYIISYSSDNLKIYGRMNVPSGNGPYPVIILNHGYYNPSSFNSGDGTQTMADILARNGYLTLASDYRGHGKSDSDGQRGGHKPEYSIDVLNLLASVKSVEKADINQSGRTSLLVDTNRIGMWGHSMGGEVSMRAIEATNKVKAVALWAPTSANAADNHAFYGGGRRSPAGSSNPTLEGASPINYLKYVTIPISLHQGLADTEVRPEWSKELNEALKQEGKTVEYFEYEGQDHNFRNLGWDIISKRTIEFFDRYLK